MSGMSREVPPMARAAIAARAEFLRRQWTLVDHDDPDAFPVVDYIEIVLLRALPDLSFQIMDDMEMPGYEGATWPDRLVIRIPNTVYEDACIGRSRARFTIAHELGHLFLHRGVPFARAIAPGGGVEPYRDSEWQAHEFAAALLMPRYVLDRMSTIQEVATRCQVSEQAVQTRLAKLKIKKPHG